MVNPDGMSIWPKPALLVNGGRLLFHLLAVVKWRYLPFSTPGGIVQSCASDQLPRAGG